MRAADGPVLGAWVGSGGVDAWFGSSLSVKPYPGGDRWRGFATADHLLDLVLALDDDLVGISQDLADPLNSIQVLQWEHRAWFSVDHQQLVL